MTLKVGFIHIHQVLSADDLALYRFGYNDVDVAICQNYVRCLSSSTILRGKRKIYTIFISTAFTVFLLYESNRLNMRITTTIRVSKLNPLFFLYKRQGIKLNPMNNTQTGYNDFATTSYYWGDTQPVVDGVVMETLQQQPGRLLR